MKMITWAKRCLTKFNRHIALFTLSLTLGVCAYAKVETSHLFVQLSDAMAETKKQQATNATLHLVELEKQFIAIPSSQSTAGQAVSFQLKIAKTSPSLENLEQLAKALYAFEKEQNPVDYQQKRQQFAKRVMPIYQQLYQAIQAQQLDAVQASFKRFNSTWTANEKVVRETSLGHYGQIETAMTLLRIAMLSTPANFEEMAKQAEQLGIALNEFKSGKVLQPQKAQGDLPQTLPEGIRLLEQGYTAFEKAQFDIGQAHIRLFIQQWPMFEGEVRTRNGRLYQQVESELPLIMVRTNQAENLQAFQSLISELKQLKLGDSYGIIDAMLILLREGLEALLIIMALLTTLNVTNQPKAKRWIYAGAGLGIFASVIGAIALQQLFPAITAGTQREILEGVIGILAVMMMLFVGAWLHSKASLQGWQSYLNKQVAKAMATGSLISMFSLSFLSVFREGAETILFYAGMLPLIRVTDLLLGLGFALAILAVIAFTMQFWSKRVAIHHLFKVMTLLIYLLGFKILGVSVQALQLTQVLPTHLLEGLPNIAWIGFYPSVEGLLAQGLYLLLIPFVAKFFKN